MKKCPRCGNTNFHKKTINERLPHTLQYNPQTVEVNVYVCSQCGFEIREADYEEL